MPLITALQGPINSHQEDKVDGNQSFIGHSKVTVTRTPRQPVCSDRGLSPITATVVSLGASGSSQCVGHSPAVLGAREGEGTQ